MLSKAKTLYQVKLILDYLPAEEYRLIPQETIDYIENNFEYDENFTINPDIPLEDQDIDDATYELLDRIVKLTERAREEEERKALDNAEKDEYLKFIKKSNQDYDMKMENIKLKKLVQMLKDENSKIKEAKELLSRYNELLKQSEEEIEKLEKSNRDLYNCINELPNIIKKIFLKNFNS